MASAWGKSWGLAFGAAFGLLVALPPAVDPAGDLAGGGGQQHSERHALPVPTAHGLPGAHHGTAPGDSTQPAQPVTGEGAGISQPTQIAPFDATRIKQAAAHVDHAQAATITVANQADFAQSAGVANVATDLAPLAPDGVQILDAKPDKVALSTKHQAIEVSAALSDQPRQQELTPYVTQTAEAVQDAQKEQAFAALQRRRADETALIMLLLEPLA